MGSLSSEENFLASTFRGHVANVFRCPWFCRSSFVRWGGFVSEDVVRSVTSSGGCQIEEWKKISTGQKHRSGDLPAVIGRSEYLDKTIDFEEYWQDGVLHREGNKPAVLSYNDVENPQRATYEGYYTRGKKYAEKRYHGMDYDLAFTFSKLDEEGHLHCSDGPAETRVDLQSGVVVLEQYYAKGRLHRDLGPACICRSPETGAVTHESYYVNGQLHRVDGPACIQRDKNTLVITSEDYYVNGVLHRRGGPAHIRRDSETGELYLEAYYIDGICQDPEFQNRDKLQKTQLLMNLAEELGFVVTPKYRLDFEAPEC